MISIVPEAIESYAVEHSSSTDSIFDELEAATREHMSMPQMLTGKLEGRFLKLMVMMSGAKHVLEVGMFSGYSALWMASGLTEKGKLTTCEINESYIEFAKPYFKKASFGHKITVKNGAALETIRNIKKEEVDFVFIDADKLNYDAYYESALDRIPKGGWILLDNMLWSGNVLNSDQDEETYALHSLNEKIAKDERVENTLLTIRDGIQLVRKIK
ncbi:MAG: class I SAM-dependent methyltransferase [Bdellovibrionales bacterium]|nr:class I SAM-dependent methyltransferase [Bdellovibrionales bacterium]